MRSRNVSKSLHFPFVVQLYLQWMDSKNYIEFTRPWYSRQLSFPLTLILPQMAFRRMENRLTTHLNCVSSVEVDGKEVGASLHLLTTDVHVVCL